MVAVNELRLCRLEVEVSRYLTTRFKGERDFCLASVPSRYPPPRLSESLFIPFGSFPQGWLRELLALALAFGSCCAFQAISCLTAAAGIACKLGAATGREK